MGVRPLRCPSIVFSLGGWAADTEWSVLVDGWQGGSQRLGAPLGDGPLENTRPDHRGRRIDYLRLLKLISTGALLCRV